MTERYLKSPRVNVRDRARLFESKQSQSPQCEQQQRKGSLVTSASKKTPNSSHEVSPTPEVKVADGPIVTKEPKPKRVRSSKKKDAESSPKASESASNGQVPISPAPVPPPPALENAGSAPEDSGPLAEACIPPKNTLELVKQFNEILSAVGSLRVKSTSLDSGLSEIWDDPGGRRKKPKNGSKNPEVDRGQADSGTNWSSGARVSVPDVPTARVQGRHLSGERNAEPEFRSGDNAKAKCGPTKTSSLGSSSPNAGQVVRAIFRPQSPPSRSKWKVQQIPMRDGDSGGRNSRSIEKEEESADVAVNPAVECYYGENGGKDETSQIAELLTSVQKIKEEFEKCGLEEDGGAEERHRASKIHSGRAGGGGEGEVKEDGKVKVDERLATTKTFCQNKKDKNSSVNSFADNDCCRSNNNGSADGREPSRFDSQGIVPQTLSREKFPENQRSGAGPSVCRVEVFGEWSNDKGGYEGEKIDNGTPDGKDNVLDIPLETRSTGNNKSGWWEKIDNGSPDGRDNVLEIPLETRSTGNNKSGWGHAEISRDRLNSRPDGAEEEKADNGTAPGKEKFLDVRHRTILKNKAEQPLRLVEISPLQWEDGRRNVASHQSPPHSGAGGFGCRREIVGALIPSPDDGRMEKRLSPSASENSRKLGGNPFANRSDRFTPSPSHFQTGYFATPKPLSPTGKVQVRSKPELPSYFTFRKRPALRKVTSDPHHYDSGAVSDGEKAELDKIETILGELDFSKFLRGGATTVSSGATPPSPNRFQRTTLRSLSQQASATQPQPSSTEKSHDEKLRELRELTEKLKPAINKAKQELNLGRSGVESGSGASSRHVNSMPHEYKSRSLPRRHHPVFRSASVPQVDDLEDDPWDSPVSTSCPSHSDSVPRSNSGAGERFDFRGFATLPRRRMEGKDSSTAGFSYETDPVQDEGLVVDSTARPNYAQTYRSLTSTSAPATPGPYHRTLESIGTDGTPRSVATTQVPILSPLLFGSLDRRKRRKGPAGYGSGGEMVAASKSGNGRSLTYPPQRRSSVTEGMEYTSVDSNGIRSYGAAPGSAAAADMSVRNPDVGQQLFPSELSLADSHLSPGEMTYDATYGDVLERMATDPDGMSNYCAAASPGGNNGKLPKKKHYSDPSGEKNNDGLLDLPEFIACAKSEPQLPGDARGRSPISLVPFRHEPAASRAAGESAAAAGEAPTEGRDTKSPLQQRRYSKKRLRGPYGEMLEEEMRKSGEKHLQKLIIAEELSFLNDFMDKKMAAEREGGGDVARPATPTSPTELSLLHLSSQSLDENVLRASATILDNVNGNFHRRKVSANIPLAVGDPMDCSPPISLTSSVPAFLGVGPKNDGTWNLCEVLDADNEDFESLLKQPQDTRTHVVAELYDTEKSYVESLQILVNKYFRPLKCPEYSGLVDVNLVDEMFFEIPEILAHHEIFLEVLRQRLENWDNKQKVGDVFVDSFTKQQVIETYTAFINNWKAAKEAIKVATQAKPAFAKFLEHMSREHRGKLTLDALLIMPVQRIPRYELLIKELLKHTQVDHPDHRLLLIAQKEVHDLAVKINRMEREAYEAEQMQMKLKEMEGMIEGLIDLVHPLRMFLRYDLVTMSGSLGAKKDRCLFLFTDLLIVTSIKRKSGTIRRTTSSLGSPGSLSNLLEANKYKLLMRISLDDLDVARTNDVNIKKVLNDIRQLEEDVTALNQINDLAATLNCPHQNLDELLKEMTSSVSKQLLEKQTSDSQLLCLELTVTTQVGMEIMPIIFSAPEKRATWEASFHEAKQKLALSTDRRPPPEFMYPLPIRKTRAGLQFTCAAPTLGLNSHNLRDVWVCNSDGYVGQVCVLSLQPEPTVTSCNGVCNARILCITSIPATMPAVSEGQGLHRRSAYLDNKVGISISIEDVDEEEICGGNGNIQLDSDSSEEEKESSSDCPDEDNNRKKNEMSPNEEIKQDEVDNQQPTMWLGTEDGCIHVYNCNDNIRIKKNKIKLQHPAAIHCIMYLDGRVFISLANGDLSVYQRDQSGGGWETNEPITVNVGSSVAPVTRMIAVMGKLWCGCQNTVKIINVLSLEIEHSFAVHLDSNRPIQCMVTSGLGVWFSVQNSSVIKLYHATSYEMILDVNVAPAVSKMLAAGCDDIIRQHKAACLRVTSLLACKDLLWIGTSAGVVLNLALPHLTSTTTKLTNTPNVSGIPHGHTGHVRFLTCVEMTPSQDASSRPKYSHRSIKYKDGHSIGRRASTSTLGSNRLLVISGGDGYEDFRNTNYSEAAGRDDSTNHLLLWQV